MSRRLLDFMEAGQFPHYFDSSLNLLEDKDPGVLSKEARRIGQFFEQADQILLKEIID